MNTIKSSLQAELFDEDLFLGTYLKQQIEILKGCLANKQSLSIELKLLGKNYDDLQYQINFRPVLRDKRFYSLNDFQEKPDSIPVVSFFSGAGGLDLGFEAAGFYNSVLIEKNPLFCETLKYNRPAWDIQLADVSDKTKIIDVLSKRIGSSKQFDGVFVGGPPCQPFSIASNQRFNKNGDNFKRTGFAFAPIYSANAFRQRKCQNSNVSR